MSRPIARSGTGASHALAVRFDRAVIPNLELGAGLEVGMSRGDEPLARLALLPGIAFRFATVGELEFRIEEQIGWQIVHGHLTLDGIPLRGTETRSFHDELALAVDAPLTNGVELRARAGLVLDGIYPAGHASTRAGPFVGISFVIATR